MYVIRLEIKNLTTCLDYFLCIYKLYLKLYYNSCTITLFVINGHNFMYGFGTITITNFQW